MRKITDEEIRKFDDDGFVVCREVLHDEELANFQSESQRLIDDVMAGGPSDKWCSRGPEGVPYYLSYLHHQPNNFSLRLLAHPFVGDLLTRMVGPDFIPCFESLVFKLPENGSSVAWHRDGSSGFGDERIFNIDIYPDKSNADNGGVWVVPGSHRWDSEHADQMIERGKTEFHLPEAIPTDIKPGDVLLHHVKVLHGSGINRSKSLRRVVYLDNRAARWIKKYGWFSKGDELISKRSKLYQHALAVRRSDPYASDDEQFEYTVPDGLPLLGSGEKIDLQSARE